MKNSGTIAVAISLALLGGASGGAFAGAAKSNPPSKYTIDVQKHQRESLPFSDKRDFEEAKRGFIAEPDYKKIMAEAGNVAWDMGSYEWLLQGKDFDSIHPSLQRQAILNMAYGLYEVLPDKIYQVRGFDLTNITFIKGDTGWIVFDPLSAKETAAAALKFINEQLKTVLVNFTPDFEIMPGTKLKFPDV